MFKLLRLLKKMLSRRYIPRENWWMWQKFKICFKPQSLLSLRARKNFWHPRYGICGKTYLITSLGNLKASYVFPLSNVIHFVCERFNLYLPRYKSVSGTNQFTGELNVFGHYCWSRTSITILLLYTRSGRLRLSVYSNINIS